MLNFKKKKEEEKIFVNYKKFPPARVIASERRGRKLYLFLKWENYPVRPRWVKAESCLLHTPQGKKILSDAFNMESLNRGKAELNWFEKLIVKLQNWWYGGKD